MKIDVFNEIQDPRPWQEGHQHARITEALAQAQQPHPPLWQAAATPASFEEAGRRGVGVLGAFFTFVHCAETDEQAIVVIGRVLRGDDVAPDPGIDRLMAFHQVDSLKHEDVMRSLQLVGDLIPEFDKSG
ncbi:hypothetical protein [Saccharothrix luteola]|uniref:hypothetical protein n=1 Tax=Saccharothrix luteola TaxID=2893018 RepID=UPI001E3B6402|nr:hypothetical protein [Saccharothrix luteola]MCC8250733.1 hypothetical protein [Saccharothrix luteola]